MKRIISEPYLSNSKSLRKNQTPWEAKLWRYLRAKRFYGLNFKRQYMGIGGCFHLICGRWNDKNPKRFRPEVQLEKARFLINKGVDLEEKDKNSGLTPLIIATNNGNQKMVELLIDSGANIN